MRVKTISQPWIEMTADIWSWWEVAVVLVQRWSTASLTTLVFPVMSHCVIVSGRQGARHPLRNSWYCTYSRDTARHIYRALVSCFQVQSSHSQLFLWDIVWSWIQSCCSGCSVYMAVFINTQFLICGCLSAQGKKKTVVLWTGSALKHYL